MANELRTKIEEMDEAMTASIKNAEKVIEQQRSLIGVIESSTKKEYFKEFIEETKKQIENIEGQIATLQNRKSCGQIVMKCLDNPEIVDSLENFSFFLGLFSETK